MDLKQRNTIDWNLSITDTLVLKGIAICGMLCWHLFYCPNPVGKEFSALAKWFGIMGDVCVSAFLFASGYGLTKQFAGDGVCERGGGSIKFVIRRLIRFYGNFWVILLIMLPIGIIGFHRPLVESESLIEISKVWLREIFALSGHSSYNASWWFNALIIEMYILFPILYYGLKYACLPTLLFVFLERHLSIAHINMDVQIYLPIFTIGMFAAMYSNKITSSIQRVPQWCVWVVALCCLLIPMVTLPLLDDGAIYYRGIKLYWLFTIGLTMMIVLTRRVGNKISQSIAYLGRHSSNIYFMHTLIFFYWFPKYFYALHNPLIIFCSLLIICVIISISIEKLKEVSCYNQLVNSVLKKIEKF